MEASKKQGLIIKRLNNSQSFWSISSALLKSAGALVTLPLALAFLDASEIGLYYVFLSLAALSQLLDLGFNQTLARFASQANSGASKFQSFGVPNAQPENRPNRKLLQELLATAKSFYAVVGASIAVLFSLAFAPFISAIIKDTGLDQTIIYCWIGMAAAAGSAFYSEFWRTSLFGIGATAQAHQVTVVSHGISISIVALLLLLGAGLWSFPLGRAAYALLNSTISKNRLLTRLDIATIQLSWDRSIIKSMWPTSWRQGTMAIGDFLVRRSSVLVCSALFGLEATASYGLSLQVLGVIAAVCLAPLEVVNPTLTRYRMQDDLERLKSTFKARTYLGILVFLVLSICSIFIGPLVLQAIGANTYLLEPHLYLILLITWVLSMHQNAWILLVLTENVNPFAFMYLLTGLASLIAAYSLGEQYGIEAMLLAQLTIPVLFLNWWPIIRGISGLKPARRNISPHTNGDR